MSNRWLPLVGGILMNLALGALYAWSVFVLPLEKEFGWTRADTSWVFTIAIVCFALSFIAAGRLQDLKGPRICAFVGGVLVSAGFMLCSLTSSLLSLYIFFGVMVGGYGAGSAILGPLATRLITAVGWRSTFQILGAVFFVMTMAGTLLLKNPPPGYRPPGWEPKPGAATGRADIPTHDMLKTPTFYA